MARLQGEWKIGEVWLDGSEVPPVVMAGKAYGFSWGSHCEGSVRLALALLRRFCHRDLAVEMACAFSLEVLSELPQGDFTIEIDVDAWMAKRLALKQALARKARRSCNGSDCVRRSHGGSRYGAAR